VTDSKRRRQELSRQFTLGAPIMLAQLFQMGMGVLDTVMAGRYSSTDLAGVSVAGSIWFPIMILTIGVLGAITPIVAQMFGAGETKNIGHIARQGLLAAVVVSFFAIVAINQVHWLFAIIDMSEEIRRIAVGYLQALAWGLPGLAFYTVLRGTADGLGKTRPAMVIAGVLLVVNGFLNYAFIYGRFGAPELGGVGCGVATAIILWLEFLGMAIVISLPFFRRFALLASSWRPDLEVFGRFLNIGLPIGITTFFEVAIYSLVTLLLAGFGERLVAAQAIVINLNGLTFMVPLSLGMAATIRVGHCVGAQDYAGARIAGEVTTRSALVFATGIAVLLLIFRYDLVALYTTDPTVLDIAATLLLFVAAYQFVDDTQVTAIGILRGYKDTRVPMAYALTGYWLIGLPIAVVFGYGYLGFPKLGIYGFWCGLTAGLGFVAVTANVRRIRLGRNVERIEALAAR